MNKLKGATEFEQVLLRLQTLTDFIQYLKHTDDSEWQVDTVRDKRNSKNCVMGHLINWYYGKGYQGNISVAWDVFEAMWATTYMVYPVNDGKTPSWMKHKYDQSTPKERVIAYLTNLNEGREETTPQLWEEGK